MTTKQVFDERQPRISISKSGRAMVALNEQVVTTREFVPVGMDDDGVMLQVEHEKTQYAYDVYWLNDVQHEVEVLGAAKTAVLSDIDAYDASPSVNSFVLDGQRVWLDFELRDRVYQGNERLKNVGREETTLWFGDKCYNMSIEQAQSIISHIEAYAKDCYNATAQHKANVSAMETVEEVLGYDYTKGYPEKLTISLSEKGKVKSEKLW